MASLPACYGMNDHTMMFFKQYKQMAFYDKTTGAIAAVHDLTNGRKMSINSNGELVLSVVPSGTFFKTTFVMDTNDTIGISDNCLVFGTGDLRGGTPKLTSFPLNNESCTVIIKWESANQISVSTTCGNSNCTSPLDGCKTVTDQSGYDVYS